MERDLFSCSFLMLSARPGDGDCLPMAAVHHAAAGADPAPPPQSAASSFGEKFSRVKFSPSLTLFGGKPMEGWIAVTVSGLVTVSLLKPSGQVLTSTESLCRLRGRVALADIAFTGGGNIVVATADGSSASPVQFYKVCVSVVSEKCRIDTEILPSLFMRCTTDLNRRDRVPAITHLKFLARDMSEQVSPLPCIVRPGPVGLTQVLAELVLPGAPGESRFLLFQLLEAPHPWLAAPSSILTASSAASPVSLPLTLPPPSYEDLVMTLGPWGVQDHPHPRGLNSTCKVSVT